MGLNGGGVDSPARCHCSKRKRSRGSIVDDQRFRERKRGEKGEVARLICRVHVKVTWRNDRSQTNLN